MFLGILTSVLCTDLTASSQDKILPYRPPARLTEREGRSGKCLALGQLVHKIQGLSWNFMKQRVLSIRPKIPEIPGEGANGPDIYQYFIPKFLVYLARLA